MACERYRGALTDVGAGAPAPAELETHLAACQACRAELQAVQRALALADASLRDLLAAEAGPAFRARIRKAVGEEAERVRGRRHFFWTWGAVPAIGTALMVLAALVAWRQARSPNPPAGSAVVESQGQPTEASLSRPSEAKPPSPAPQASASSSAATARGPLQVAGLDARAGARQRTAIIHTAATEPEVLVPPGEADALLRFAVELRHRQVTPDSLLVTDLGAPLQEPKAIEIAPLEIVPLDSSGAF